MRKCQSNSAQLGRDRSNAEATDEAEAKVAVAAGDASAPKTAKKTSWRALFDGRSLDGWRATEFGGEGDVYVEKGQLIVGFGAPLTGITYQNELPTKDYEIRLEAKRVDGSDFFCGLTFPVMDSHCSFIVGGWGGGVVGLSSIDGLDASENETTDYMEFENGRWYKIRIRVTAQRIDAWIDDKLFADQDIEGRKISIRPEVELSRPLGIATFDTQAALRHIEIRKIDNSSQDVK